MFVTPITRGEYLVGKIVPYIAIAIVQVPLIMLVGRFWFRVPINGSLCGDRHAASCCSCSRPSGRG